MYKKNKIGGLDSKTLDIVKEPIMIFEDNQIIYFNKAFQKVFGKRNILDQKIFSKHINKFFSKENLEFLTIREVIARKDVEEIFMVASSGNDQLTHFCVKSQRIGELLTSSDVTLV